MSETLRKYRCLLVWGLVGLSLAFSARARGAEPKAVATASHAIVPGFERFQTAPRSDRVLGGRILLGELNCVSCHQADKAVDALLLRKQAPVLDAVGSRVRAAYVRSYLNDPQATKPGTTMPHVLAALPEDERAAAAEALTHFLATTGGLKEARAAKKSIDLGRTLYHQVGCVACHGPLDRRAKPTATLATSMPLGTLAEKYTVPSLTAFLSDPLKVRPSGRMPALNLKPNEATELASYLLQDLLPEIRPNLTYRYYEGSWQKLPDFATLKPTATGQAVGFDLGVGRRQNNSALVFEGFLKIDHTADFRFHLRSDDGSRLRIDDTVVVDNDGIHPASDKSGSIHLAPGMHPFEVAIFNGGGEYELDVEYESKSIGRQEVSPALWLTREVPDSNGAKPDDAPQGGPFRVDAALAAKGREWFAKVGCASCHDLTQRGARIASTLKAEPLDALRPEGGCLSSATTPGVPKYTLSDSQRVALIVALKALHAHRVPTSTPRDLVAQTLTTFNCYACHQRDGIGGIEEERNASFQTTQKEMGDEGRIPPSLNGVGAKLAPDYFKQIVRDGSKDRPYMLTRMPRFGKGVDPDALVAAFTTLDPIAPVETPTFDLPAKKVKATGRFLAGGEALGCIKCHTFKGIKSEGVQAIDMTVMTRRLKHDWFHRYLLDPQAYRPGTRMPGAWPMGKSLLPKVLDGDTSKQIEAIWHFLADGTNAAEPYGLGTDPIPLVAENEAIIYRNFIQGGGPRAIGVGYPEKAHLVFDANEMRIAQIWQGAFIDASKHWSGRGVGFQSPLGDNVVSLPSGPAFATLKSLTDAWPTARPKEVGYKFRGYQLGKGGRPSFLYDAGPVHVEDAPEPVAGPEAPALKRTLTLTATEPMENLWFRAAVGTTIEPRADDWYQVDGEWSVRVQADEKPVVRKSDGKTELLIPIPSGAKSARIVEQFAW